MAKVLLHVPVVASQAERYAKCRASWLALDTTGHELDLLETLYDNLQPRPEYPDPVFKVLEFKMEKARRLALDQGYDYLFNVEHDHILPPDTLQRLLAHRLPVVSGLYCHRPSRGVAHRLGPMVQGAAGRWREMTDADITSHLMEVLCYGFGCLLLHRKVLERVRFEWGDDGRYCMALRDEGFRVMLDPTVQTVHVDIDGTEVRV